MDHLPIKTSKPLWQRPINKIYTLFLLLLSCGVSGILSIGDFNFAVLGSGTFFLILLYVAYRQQWLSKIWWWTLKQEPSPIVEGVVFNVQRLQNTAKRCERFLPKPSSPNYPRKLRETLEKHEFVHDIKQFLLKHIVITRQISLGSEPVIVQTEMDTVFKKKENRNQPAIRI